MALGLLVATCGTSCAYRIAEGPAALPNVSSLLLEEHIRYLASDQLRGRGTGTPGYDLAARYVADHFAAIHLLPAGSDGYLQSVPLRRARAIEGSTLVLVGPAGRADLRPYDDFIPLPDFGRNRVEVSAPLVLAGFGVTAPDRGHDDYRDIDARNKIVVLLTGAPSSFEPAERAHYANARVKYQNAISHGALGILIVRSPDQSFPWDRLVSQLRAGGMRWLGGDGEPGDTYPDLRGVAILSGDTASRLFDGAPRSLSEVFAEAQAGRPPAFDLPVHATLSTVSVHDHLQSPNVAGLLPGSDPELEHEVVILTAHLDHLGVGEPVRGDSVYNGAVDNASGSAALLEIARAFAELPRRPRRSVMFLAVTGEEMGMLGSDYFAAYPTVPVENIVANVNTDGLSVLYPLRQVIAFGAEHSTLDSTVARVASRLDVEVAPDPFPQEAFFVRSDQISFVRRGIPSLFLFMGMRSEPGIDAAARFGEWFSTRYHTPQDDLSQPLDLEAGARQALLTFQLAVELANAAERPSWKPGDFFLRTFGGVRASQGNDRD